MPSSFQPPVSGPHDPYEKYRVEEIQKDKEPRDSTEESQGAIQASRPSAFAAYITMIIKKFLELFESTSERGLTATAESDVLEHLKQFKAALEILKMEDRSQDSPFLNSLSASWHQMLEDVLRFRRQSPLSLKMRAFIRDFQHYPENQQHTLGYYLTEYAGQKWLPFPYMEMIHRLHIQHQKSPESSSLSLWSNAISEMIRILKPANNSQ
jgi:hypothetical protein